MPIPSKLSPPFLQTHPTLLDSLEGVAVTERPPANDGHETCADQQDEDVSSRAEGQMEKADEAVVDQTESETDGPQGPVKSATLSVSEIRGLLFKNVARCFNKICLLFSPPLTF